LGSVLLIGLLVELGDLSKVSVEFTCML